MSLILEGLMFGLGLALSLGPIFIALTQTSMEKGVVPGLVVGSGVWISDLAIITLFYQFISLIKDRIESDMFQFWMGLSGCLILVGFGIYVIIKQPDLDYTQRKHTYRNYIGFWLKGFLINALNPFTFFFWMGVISTYVIGRSIAGFDAYLFLGTIFIVIVASDIFKVYLANSLRKWLTPNHINHVSNFSGAIMIVFGIFLGLRVV